MLPFIRKITGSSKTSRTSRSSSCPISHLPIELLITILEKLCPAEDRLPSESLTLKHCSRVCRQWRNPSQELLFSTASLNRSKTSLKQMVKMFRRNPALASYVRDISIHIKLVSKRREESYNPADFLPILSLFPKLCGIVLLTEDCETGTALAAEVAAAQSNSGHLPQLMSLVLELERPTDSHLVYNLLALWPSIQYLSCNSGCFGNLPVPVTRPNFTLRHLGLENMPPPQVLEWLLPSQTSLQSLHMYPYGDWRSTTQSFLERYGSGLSSLRLDYAKEELFQYCPNLEELNIMYMMSGEVIESFPKGLKRVGIGYPTPEGNAPLVRLVRSLPDLRLLTVPDFMEVEECNEVEDVARRNGVTVVYKVARKWEYPDPGIWQRLDDLYFTLIYRHL